MDVLEVGSNNGTRCLGNVETLSTKEEWIFIAVAAGIIILHVLMAKRKSSGGRVAIPVPIDFLLLSDRRRRAAYCLVYGGATAGIGTILLGNTLFPEAEVKDNPFIAVLVKILSFSLVGLVYYPMFISVTTSNSIISNIIGLLYTSSFLVAKIVFLAECPDTLTAVSLVLSNLPAFLAIVVIILYLLTKLVRNIKRGSEEESWPLEPQEETPVLDADENIWQVAYVKRLFHPQPPPSEQVSSCFKHWKLQVYNPDHPFQYSIRVLVPLVVGTCVMYWLILLLTVLFGVFIQGIRTKHTRSHDGKVILIWLAGSAFCGMVIATLVSLSQVFYIAKHFRRDMLLMYKGSEVQIKRIRHAKLAFRPFKQHAFTMFAGYQSAVLVMGFLFQWILFFIACAVISVFFAYGAITSTAESFNLFLNILSPVVASLLIYVLQHVCVFFFFMEDGGKDSLNINNRRWHNNLAYFTFFWNMMIGFFVAIVRVILSFFVASVMVSRLSKPVMLPGYEVFDRGNVLYTNFVRMENHLTNPCLVVFSRLLLATQGKIKGQSGSADRSSRSSLFGSGMAGRSYGAVSNPHDDSNSSPFRVSRLARNRWYVAVTMVLNPSVVKTRRGDHIPKLQRALEEPAPSAPSAATATTDGAEKKETDKMGFVASYTQSSSADGGGAGGVTIATRQRASQKYSIQDVEQSQDMTPDYIDDIKGALIDVVTA
ncbi:stimulated by retinoic acid gene 6 protein-like isoform X1 [Sycon ciliatum]|uniref:stimulated by retinoic acid gene 6 protein-like isoform X1 n=1 Tax=Sycon ciliatum TaxID=27933 RepID=UPI0031F65696